eukprot:TRINITY_DN11563_c0_g1_i1.p1 TRINITY_DN11563_c0_g1~~TRINITY_DN11563_c0_g1_i1.p1  ORF type:complete len:172 (-),score=17.27 TRINITY_DN11563_c0_g1_i1:791-1279(-)
MYLTIFVASTKRPEQKQTKIRQPLSLDGGINLLEGISQELLVQNQRNDKQEDKNIPVGSEDVIQDLIDFQQENGNQNTIQKEICTKNQNQNQIDLLDVDSFGFNLKSDSSQLSEKLSIQNQNYISVKNNKNLLDMDTTELKLGVELNRKQKQNIGEINLLDD